MSKSDNPLIIEPHNELKFKGPFTKPVSSYMKLSNPSDHKICFKIKTTAPRRYCVRPNSGIVDPNSSVEIAVSLQPFEFDVNEKNKHKFMVQSISAPDGEFNIDTLWREVDPTLIVDYKLKCLFENPAETRDEGEDIGLVYPEEKAKRVSDTTSSTTQNQGSDGELLKAAQEVTHLREGESNLRKENLLLQEEVLRLRLQQEQNMQSSRKQTQTGREYDISLNLIIALGIFIALVGIGLGKFVL